MARFSRHVPSGGKSKIKSHSATGFRLFLPASRICVGRSLENSASAPLLEWAPRGRIGVVNAIAGRSAGYRGVGYSAIRAAKIARRRPKFRVVALGKTPA